jgi:hypothetical protein
MTLESALSLYHEKANPPVIKNSAALKIALFTVLLFRIITFNPKHSVCQNL